MAFELPQRVSGARPVSAVPAHLQCSSCSKPLFNARQTPHGCRLCHACVTGLLHEVEKRPCPGHTEACTLRDHHSEEDAGGGGSGGEVEVSQATCFPDMATRREVAKLRVRCPNCDAGCSVQLEWARMDQHVQQSCDWHSLRCEQCKELILKKDMQRHTSSECRHRKETCDLCSQLVTHSEMETSHRNLQSDVCCPRFSARCPHCSERSTPMDRRGYVAHLSECPERPRGASIAPQRQIASSQRLQRAIGNSGSRPARDSATDSSRILFDERLTDSPQEPVQDPAAPSANFIATGGSIATQHFPLPFGGAEQVHVPVRDPESSDRPVQLLHPSNLPPAELGFSRGHSSRVAAVCRLGNISFVATGGADGSVLLWHLDSMCLQHRMLAPSAWGAVTHLNSPTGSLLLLSWQQRTGLVRIRCGQLLLQGIESLLRDMLNAGVAELLDSHSPVTALCPIPENHAAVVGFEDSTLALVAAQGSFVALRHQSAGDLDATAGPPVLLRIVEPGYMLCLQLGNPRLYLATLRTALPGPAIVGGWRASDRLDLLDEAAALLQAFAAGDLPGEACLIFPCGIPGRISVLRVDSNMQLCPVVSRFLCHAQPITALCRLTDDLSGALPFLATASAGGEVSVWRMQAGAALNQLAEVSHFKHSCEVTTMKLLSFDAQLHLLVGDARGNVFCLKLPVGSSL